MPAIPVHHTGTENSKWDGPAAVAAMPAAYATLYYCHAWWSDAAANKSGSHDSSATGDGDPDDKKGNYKFPHARTKGGPANIPGCRNGLSRLSSASIPSGDDAGVKAHLQAHIDDWNKKSGSDDMWSTEVWNRAVQLGMMTAEQRVRAGLPRANRLSEQGMGIRVSNLDSSTARLDINDEIGWSPWSDSVTARGVQNQLNDIKAGTIEVHVNSPGGDVFDGIAITNMLRSHPATINVVVDGLAASAASFIAMAGDSVAMMPNSQMMIHDASGICAGNGGEMRQMADLLDKASDNIADMYARRSGAPVEQWRAAMKAESWYNDQEAVDAGLADRVIDLSEQRTAPTDQQSSRMWNLSWFRYDGRQGAPAPQAAIRPTTPDPVDDPWSPAAIRSAFGAASNGK